MKNHFSDQENKKNCCHPLNANQEPIWFQTVKKKLLSYKPLIVIFIFCLILAYVQSCLEVKQYGSFMYGFMGYFFIFLSMFKFFDLNGFVESFATYDLITKKFKSYGYIYPFIELFLGVAYLISFHLFLVNVITLVVMTISGLGVLKSTLSGQNIKCACLGTVLNVPLSTVSILENFGMSAMAAYNLIFF